MTIKIVQLDARFAGHGQFKYLIESTSDYKTGYPLGYLDNVKVAHQWREWCWTTFGPSIEREWIVHEKFRDYDYKWCWYNGPRDCKIYLLGDDELAWFNLRWS